MQEGQLLQRARQNDAQALAEIYDRYADPIYRYLYRFLGDAAQAEDLTGEVFVKLLKVLNTPRAPRDKLQGWLYRVAHNLAIDWFRRQSRVVSWELDEGLIAQDLSPGTEAEKKEAQQQIRKAIRQLTPAQQRVILLRFGEGFKISEVSEYMGKSEEAVKVLQYRATKRLRRLLEGERRHNDVQ